MTLLAGRTARPRRVLFVYNSNEHLGMTALSAVLRARGHEVRLAYDPQIFRGEPLIRVPPLLKLLDQTKRIVALARDFAPDVVGFGCYTDNFAWMISVARAMKDAGLPALRVFGGVHVTSVPEVVGTYDEVDVLVLGEAEEAFVELVEGIEGGQAPRGIRNTWVRGEDGWERQSLRPYIDDLDALPIRDFELFYRKVPAMEENYLCMASRGCPYACSYCAVEMYHRNYAAIGDKRRVRRRSVEGVIDELKVIKGRGRVRTVSFMDDVFTSDKRWLGEFLDRYSRDIALPFWCYTYPAGLDVELAKRLRAAGCWMITMGVQSGSRAVRKEMFNRRESDDLVLSTAEAIKGAGIRLSVDKIIGAPGEGPGERQADVELFRRIGPDRILVFPLTYFPGTDMIRKGLESGELTKDEADAIDRGHLEQNPALGRLRADPKAYARLRLQMGLIPLLGARSAKLDALVDAVSTLPGAGALHPALLAINARRIGDHKFDYLLKVLTGAQEVP